MIIALQWLPLKELEKVTRAYPFEAMMEIARIIFLHKTSIHNIKPQKLTIGLLHLKLTNLRIRFEHVVTTITPLQSEELSVTVLKLDYGII